MDERPRTKRPPRWTVWLATAFAVVLGLELDHERTVRQSGERDIAVRTDLDRLSQVFINILANAQKYCDADTPQVHIRVDQRDGQHVVDFHDNGSGISEANQSVIFEKFSRLSDHAKAGGAGLGLAICREIMERLGGAIAYVPGQGGAMFRVTLPIGGPGPSAMAH